MENKKETILKILNIAGALLLILGALSASLMGTFNAAAIAVLTAGAVLMSVYFVVERKKVISVITSRSTRYGINAVIYTLLVIGVVVVVQAIATVNAKQFDLTKSKRFSLAGQTEKALDSLKTHINAYYFYSETARNLKVEDTLKSYEKYSNKFSFTSVDADKNPAIARKYKIDRYGVVVLERKDNLETEAVEVLTEESITNGILRLSKGEKKSVYFTKGHGEHSLDSPKNEKTGYSVVKQQMENQNFIVKEIEIYTAKEIPADCAVLVVAGPKIDIFKQEADAIRSFVRKGGKLFILYPPMTDMPNLESLVKEYGITPHNDIVVDKVSKMLGGDFLMPVISDYDYTAITRAIGRTASFFPVCRSFDITSEVSGIKQFAIARSNTSSWGEKDLKSVREGKTAQNKDDYVSPLVVAAVSEIDFSVFQSDANTSTVGAKAKVVVFGSSEIANNTYLGVAANKDLFLNTVSFLAGEDDMVAIRAKDNSYEPLFLSKVHGRMLFIIPMIFLPLLVLSVGIMVFIRRRRS